MRSETWEYLQLLIDNDDDELLMQDLAEHGADGWEVVASFSRLKGASSDEAEDEDIEGDFADRALRLHRWPVQYLLLKRRVAPKLKPPVWG